MNFLNIYWSDYFILIMICMAEHVCAEIPFFGLITCTLVYLPDISE